jgi:hypothetical protein
VEAGWQIGQQGRQLFQSALEVLGPHLLDVTQVEQPFRFVCHGQKHGHNLTPRGSEFDEKYDLEKSRSDMHCGVQRHCPSDSEQELCKFIYAH